MEPYLGNCTGNFVQFLKELVLYLLNSYHSKLHIGNNLYEICLSYSDQLLVIQSIDAITITSLWKILHIANFDKLGLPCIKLIFNNTSNYDQKDKIGKFVFLWVDHYRGNKLIKYLTYFELI